MAAQPVVMASPTVAVKIEIPGGAPPREGFEQSPFDYLRFPWPLQDASVDELHAAHVVERIPLENVRRGARQGQDLFLAFFEEAFRVLKPAGTMTVVTTSATSDRGYVDPRVRRHVVQDTFACLSADGRKHVEKNLGLPPPTVACDFGVSTNPLVDTIEASKHPEVAAARFQTLRNVCLGLQVVLKANK